MTSTLALVNTSQAEGVRIASPATRTGCPPEAAAMASASDSEMSLPTLGRALPLTGSGAGA